MTATQEVKARKKAENAPARKARIETAKTVAIVALVVGIVAFVSGMHYQAGISSDKANAVTQAVKTASTLKR